MKAILCSQYCQPDDLVLADVPDPVAGPGEAVIAIKAAALNFFDILMIQGKYQIKPPFPFSPAAEVAGVIESVGAGVTDLKVGDRVVASCGHNGARDKIALPGIKTSLSAVMLQMMAAHEFGKENYAKLDPMTVGLPHPEAVAALISGKTEITAHFTSPPFSYIELKDSKIHRVANSADVLGRLTMDVVFAPKRFVDANPKVVQAFLDALDEACTLIANDKAAAAEIYARTAKVKTTKEEVLEMLQDKDTWFSATPEGVLKIAEFMHGVGSIKVKPANWQDMFVTQLRDRNGS